MTLTHPIKKQFVIRCDASDTHVGAVLEQDGHFVSSCFQALKGYQSRCHILVKKFYTIVFACDKFKNYIEGQPSVQVYTDHKAIEHMVEGKLSDKLYRWILSLLKYNLHIKYIAGEDNAYADALTRLRQKINLPLMFLLILHTLKQLQRWIILWSLLCTRTRHPW